MRKTLVVTFLLIVCLNGLSSVWAQEINNNQTDSRPKVLGYIWEDNSLTDSSGLKCWDGYFENLLYLQKIGLVQDGQRYFLALWPDTTRSRQYSDNDLGYLVSSIFQRNFEPGVVDYYIQPGKRAGRRSTADSDLLPIGRLFYYDKSLYYHSENWNDKMFHDMPMEPQWLHPAEPQNYWIDIWFGDSRKSEMLIEFYGDYSAEQQEKTATTIGDEFWALYNENVFPVMKERYCQSLMQGSDIAILRPLATAFSLDQFMLKLEEMDIQLLDCFIDWEGEYGLFTGIPGKGPFYRALVREKGQKLSSR